MKRFLSLLLAIMLIASMTACGSGSSSTEPNKSTAAKKLDVNITQTRAQTLEGTLTAYSDPNGCFTATIPNGWAVSTAGYDMSYWIRIYDPNNPDLQAFTLLKAECLLMDQNSKAFYEARRSYNLYTMFADMIVVEKVEDFYKQFMDYCGFMAQYEPTYAGFEYPQIYNFETVESGAYGSSMASVAIEDLMLHGYYDDVYTGQRCEGMFTGSLVNAFNAGVAGCNSMYNINAITAPYGELAEYESVLTKIFASIQYTDTFVATVIQDQQIKADAAAQLNQTLQQTSDIITQGWNERQKSYDIISEKQSDATLGYERVYDVDTGEIYRAYDGFSDLDNVEDYYKPVTDDMYSEPIVGYIEK